ncbi:ATP-binding protein [Yersinia similis]|uniref:ATP-dependent metalloprotease n=1 Tax=Yersinia similis TaxID=367190 RepID=A0A0T9QUV8_9GAMM|nr:AAA family ATPase [Yersinia similis]AHK18467.1 ATPase AAA [Yersinia similis]CFQ67596.1 ATP-dependent metalloprotease [Yersinia similis]CNC09203.1 ATP-dependent metalloprotease [Yersinia similis]CNF47893.1 ATP-dependent metalloprotease [Yersinia similis]CNF56831.1 ATP-dependent metalloprotease [Yersinia similis]
MTLSSDFQPVFNQHNECQLSLLFRELERIDLALQDYCYRLDKPRHDLFNEFLLSEEEVTARINQPIGKPHWAAVTQTVKIPLGNKHSAVAEGLTSLINRFKLTDFERDTLLLGLLPHFDKRYYGLFSLIQGEQQSQLPSFSLALDLFCYSEMEKRAQQASFLHRAPLIGCQLISIDSNKKNLAWSQTTFIADSGVYHFLLGHHYLAPALTQCAEWSAPSALPFYPASLKQSLEAVLLTEGIEPRPVVFLRGMMGSARAYTVANIFASENRQTLLVDMGKCTENDDNAILVRLKHLLREARMWGAGMVIRNLGALMETNTSLLESLSELLNQPGLRVVCLVEPYSPPLWLKKTPTLQIKMPIFTHEEKIQLLITQLPDNRSADIDPIMLSQRYNFNPESLPLILQEAELYQQQRNSADILQQYDIQKALNLRTQQNFGQLAQRITPKRTLSDLLVSDNIMQQLHEIFTAIKYREKVLASGFKDKVSYGIGISALFYGDSGTGKTMAAEVLANTIGVDLIKVDLSTVINKYVGETEKNLSRIFDLAELDAGVLFFDEADALFGKRSETKDAQDRHANIEVSYLLQRLESYPGLVILSTNNRNHLDSAFNRRFTFITRFTYPDEALRHKMWQKIWPKNIKVSSDVDFSQLAQRANITGANIRNIALLASFFSGENENQEVSHINIEAALMRELAKTGRLAI